MTECGEWFYVRPGLERRCRRQRGHEPPHSTEPDGPRDTLSEAREYVKAGRWEGVYCPCCGQYLKVWHTPFPGVAARVLCDMYCKGDGPAREWVHVPSLPSYNKGGDALKAVHWGLIEAMEGEREDGSKRNGWWRLTEHGVAFVTHEVAILRYADIVRPHQCLGRSGTPLWISEAVGRRFNWRELIGWI